MSFTDPTKARTYLSGYFRGRPVVTAGLELVYTNHNGLRKDGKTPEWFHMVSVLMYLMTMEKTYPETMPKGFESATGFTTILYLAALLHDLHEDKGYPLNALAAQFCQPVADAVGVLSKKAPNRPKKSTADYYNALAEHPIASIVKGSDRIHNVQTMPGVFDEAKMVSYLMEVDQFVLPMLKTARKNFPELRPVYENLKHVLMSQSALIRFFLEQKGAVAA